jgi:hypothetical protein
VDELKSEGKSGKEEGMTDEEDSESGARGREEWEGRLT